MVPQGPLRAQKGKILKNGSPLIRTRVRKLVVFDLFGPIFDLLGPIGPLGPANIRALGALFRSIPTLLRPLWALKGPMGPKKVENGSKKVENNKLSHPGAGQRGTIFQDFTFLGPKGPYGALKGT